MQSTHTIVDCHIHPGLGGNTNIKWFGTLGSPAQQVDCLRRAGIERACGAPIVRMQPGDFSEVRALNDAALRLRDQFPEFYIPGMHIHPRFPDESCREIERCVGGEGVRWIGELVGYLMGYADEYATPDALTIMREASRHRAVVNLHCHDLAALNRLCEEVPDLSLVLAHPGGGKDEFLTRLEVVCRFPNLHFDLSGSGIDRYGIVRQVLDSAGVDKLLFGSDFPVNNPAVYVHGVLFEDLTEAERDAVFSGNFRRLTGL